jgi:hypothetical protein
MSIGDLFVMVDKAELFEFPLSQQPFGELQELQQLLAQTHFDVNMADKLSTRWPEGKFSSLMYYKHCFKHLPDVVMFKWIWKSKVLLRVKVLHG